MAYKNETVKVVYIYSKGYYEIKSMSVKSDTCGNALFPLFILGVDQKTKFYLVYVDPIKLVLRYKQEGTF